MKTIALVALIAGTFAGAVVGADAASAPDTAHVEIAGVVSPLCSVGGAADGDNVFEMGTLIDTSTGLLLPGLTATKTLSGVFCNSLSTVSVLATPMQAQNATQPPPQGFTATVDFLASASGFGATPARFATGLAQNPDATQSVPDAFAADIVVDLTQFSANGGANLALVADPAYRGTVTITVAIAT
jgi:hypothetical protein